jgi:hypothetical protein
VIYRKNLPYHESFGPQKFGGLQSWAARPNIYFLEVHIGITNAKLNSCECQIEFTERMSPQVLQACQSHFLHKILYIGSYNNQNIQRWPRMHLSASWCRLLMCTYVPVFDSTVKEPVLYDIGLEIWLVHIIYLVWEGFIMWSVWSSMILKFLFYCKITFFVWVLVLRFLQGCLDHKNQTCKMKTSVAFQSKSVIKDIISK